MKPKIKYLFFLLVAAHALKAQVYFIFPSHVKKHHIKTVKQTTYNGKRIASITNMIFDKEGQMLQSDSYYFSKGDTIRNQKGDYFYLPPDTTRQLKYITNSGQVTRTYNYVSSILQDSTVFESVSLIGTGMESTFQKTDYYRTHFHNIQTGKRTFTEEYTTYICSTISKCIPIDKSKKYFENDMLVDTEYSIIGNQRSIGKKKIKITKTTYNYLPTNRATQDSTVEIIDGRKVISENWRRDNGKYNLQSWQETDSLKRTSAKKELNSKGEIVYQTKNEYDLKGRSIKYAYIRKESPAEKNVTEYFYYDYYRDEKSSGRKYFKETLIVTPETNSYRKFITELNEKGLQFKYSEYKCKDEKVCSEKTKEILYEYTFH